MDWHPLCGGDVGVTGGGGGIGILLFAPCYRNRG